MTSVALLAAFLPMLSYFGHWEELGLVPHAHAEAHGRADDAPHSHGGAAHDHHEHARHCHANLESCADIPLTAIGGFALLSASLAVLGAAGLLIRVAAPAAGSPRPNVIRPLVPPPRA